MSNESRLEETKEQWLGTTMVATNGQTMTLTVYNNSKDITVEFEDGTVVEHKDLCHFRKGGIENPNLPKSASKLIGSKIFQKCGQYAEVIEYIPALKSSSGRAEVVVRFEDGYETHSRTDGFKKGTVQNPNCRRWNFKNRVGESKKQECGLTCTIVKYNGANDITVEFEDGERIDTTSGMFDRGKVFHKDFGGKNRNLKNECIGRKAKTLDGHTVEIVEYQKYDKVKVRFEDGLEKWTAYGHAISGSVSHSEGASNYVDPESVIGQKKFMKCGLNMEVVDYKNTHEVTFRYEDGSEVVSSYRLMRLDQIGHPLLKHRGKSDFCGFDAVVKIRTESATYYKCTCRHCGFHGLMTPYEMMSHKCESEVLSV